MKIIIILLQPFFLLIFSISSCFAGGLIITNPYDDIAVSVEASYDSQYALNKEYRSYEEPDQVYFLMGNKKFLHFFSENNLLHVSIALKHSKPGYFYSIDKQNINGFQDAIARDKIYTKFFSIDNDKHTGRITYSLDLVFIEDKEAGFIIESLNLEILEFAIISQQDHQKEIL